MSIGNIIWVNDPNVDHVSHVSWRLLRKCPVSSEDFVSLTASWEKGFWWVIHRQIRAWNTILLEFFWHGPGSGCPYVPSPIKHGIQASHFLGMVQKGCRLFWTRTCMSASRYRLSCSPRLPLTNNLFILVPYSVAYPGVLPEFQVILADLDAPSIWSRHSTSHYATISAA